MEFTTLLASGYGEGSRIQFSRDLTAATADGWEIANSGSDNRYLWAILVREERK